MPGAMPDLWAATIPDSLGSAPVSQSLPHAGLVLSSRVVFTDVRRAGPQNVFWGYAPLTFHTPGGRFWIGFHVLRWRFAGHQC